MVSEPVKNILEEFDNIFKKLERDKELKEPLKKVSGDIKLLKLWRKELESDKQSIFIIGKTSTGKSEFHNFLLDIEKKEDALFKTSTKVETGIIQTLEHCNSIAESNADIIVKDRNEFNKLVIPEGIESSLKNEVFNIPLNNSVQIRFFRDSLTAKPLEKGNAEYLGFNIMKAIDQVNVKHPLKYLSNYRFIDTPGLASSISTTDNVVRNYFQGKSHIFWFLDASKRTMSDSYTLLQEEKELLKVSVDRIHFIANKFDLMDYDDEINSKEEVSKRKKEITNSLKETLCNILDKENISPKISFTSFKFPKKKFVENNTTLEISQIEESILIGKKGSNYDNVYSLISIIKGVLQNFKEKIISAKTNEIDEKIKNLYFKKTHLLLEKKIADKHCEETLAIIYKAKKNIENIHKENNLNTHDRYNKYYNEFKREIKKTKKNIINSISRTPDLELRVFYNKLQEVEYIKDLSLKEEEGYFKRFFHDSELDEKKDILYSYVKNKLIILISLVDVLESTVENYKYTEIIRTESDIAELEIQIKNIENNSDIINNIKNKVHNINELLLTDVEDRIEQWEPKDEESKDPFSSFIELYSLIDEHEIINNKI